MTTTEKMKDGGLCPACGEGHLSSHVAHEPVEYKGLQKELPLHYSVCDHCGSELAGAVESKQNARAMVAFKKEVDGLLSGAEIKKFREKFDLTQDMCAQIFGGGAVAFCRYENDDIAQSQQMDKLLRLCRLDPQNIAKLASQSGVELPREVSERINEELWQDIDATLKAAMAAMAAMAATNNIRLPDTSSVSADPVIYARFDSASRKPKRDRRWSSMMDEKAA